MSEAEYLFDSLPIKKDMLMIEKLEVDLGEVTINQLESSLHHIFRNKLEESIMRLLQDAEQGKVEGVEFVPVTVSKMDLLIHFLLTGQLKWWADGTQQNGIMLKELWNEVKKATPQRFIEEIHDLFKNSVALQRFLYHFEEEDIYEFIEFLLPANKQLLKATIEHHKPLKVFFQDNEKYLKYIQFRFSIPYFLKLRKQQAQPYEFLSNLYAFLSAESQTTIPTLLEILPKIKDKTSPIYAAKNEINEIFESISIKVKHQKKQEELIYPEDALTLWKEFLDKGVFVSKKITLKEGLPVVWTLLNQHWKNETINVLRSKWYQENTKKNLLNHFLIKQLETLLRLIHQQKADFVLSVQKTLIQKNSIQNLNYKILWESSLNYLLLEKKSDFNEQEYLKSMIVQISRKTNSKVKSLISSFQSLDNIQQINNSKWQELIKNLEQEFEEELSLVSQFTFKLTIEEKLEAFKHFLEKGYFPYNIQAALTREEAEMIIWELFDEKPEEVALLLIEVDLVNNSQLLNKISRQFSPELSRALLNEILPIQEDIDYLKYVFNSQIKEKDWFLNYLSLFFPSYEFKMEEIDDMFNELFSKIPEQVANIFTRLQIADDSQLVQERQNFVKNIVQLILQETKYSKILPKTTLFINSLDNLFQSSSTIEPSDNKNEKSNIQTSLRLDKNVPIESLIQTLEDFLLTRKYSSLNEFSLNELVKYLKEHHEVELIAYLKKLLPQKQKILLNELSSELREYILLLSKQNLPLNSYKILLLKYFKFNELLIDILNLPKIQTEKTLNLHKAIILLQEWIEKEPIEVQEILTLSIKEESTYLYWTKILPTSVLKQFVQLLMPKNYTTILKNVETLWKGLIVSDSEEVYQKIEENKKYELIFGYIHQYSALYQTENLIEYFIHFLEEKLNISDKKLILKVFEYVEMNEDLEKSVINVIQKFGEEIDQEIIQKELLQKRDEKILKEKKLFSTQNEQEQITSLEKTYQELKNKLSNIQSREEEAISQLEDLLSKTNPSDKKTYQRLQKEIQDAKQRKEDKIKKIKNAIQNIEDKIILLTQKIQSSTEITLDDVEKINENLKKEILFVEKELEKIRLENYSNLSETEKETYLKITNTLVSKLEKLKRELNVRYSIKEEKYLIEDEIAQSKINLENNEKEIEKILEELKEYDNLLFEIETIEENLKNILFALKELEKEILLIEKEIETVDFIAKTIELKEEQTKEILINFEKTKSEILELEEHRETLLKNNLNKKLTEEEKKEQQQNEEKISFLKKQKNEIETLLEKTQKELAEARAMKQYQISLQNELKTKKTNFQMLHIEVKERNSKILELRQKIESLEKMAEEYQEMLEEQNKLKNFINQKGKELESLENLLQKEKLEEKILNEKSEQLLKETKKKRMEYLRRANNTTQQQKAELEPKFVNNAGLVIVHPFIIRLFRMLKLVKGIAFVDEISQQRAVHILQYIAYKTQKTPEYELTLNKILCGIPLEVPIEIDVVLTQEEMDTCESMIRGVIQNWSIIKNTSNDNFRVSFIHREGKILAEKTEGWRMKVERKAIDVLMEKLTWEIKTIRLPWMEKPLYVDW
ncbi:MAG: hypothetical protein OHK0057_27330 [Thermoflexibacter sp.]